MAWSEKQRCLPHSCWRVKGQDAPIQVCSGCHNKITQTGWLKHPTPASHSSDGWGVQGQGAGNIGFIQKPLLFGGRQPPSLCAHATSSLCVC